MKTIVQIVAVVFMALALEINAWKYERAGLLVVPLGILCLFGIWLIAGGGSSQRGRLKAWGRMFLGFGAFGIGAVLHVFYMADWDVVFRENILSSWLAIACVGSAAVLVFTVIVLMHKSSLRTFQRQELSASLISQN